MEETIISLATLNGGAAVEAFDAELKKVVANIADFNTLPKEKRSITLKVTFAPSDDRSMGGVKMSCTSKLAAPRASEALVFFGKKDGQPVAVQQDPGQGKLFDQPAAGLGVKLVSMKGKGE